MVIICIILSYISLHKLILYEQNISIYYLWSSNPPGLKRTSLYDYIICLISDYVIRINTQKMVMIKAVDFNSQEDFKEVSMIM